MGGTDRTDPVTPTESRDLMTLAYWIAAGCLLAAGVTAARADESAKGKDRGFVEKTFKGEDGESKNSQAGFGCGHERERPDRPLEHDSGGGTTASAGGACHCAWVPNVEWRTVKLHDD